MEGPLSMKDGVLLFPSECGVSQHEHAVHQVLGRKIAALLGTRFLGEYAAEHAAGNYYLIPSDTLIGSARCQELGITCPEDFFGGTVAQPFMATKAISHPLPDHPRHVPPGWSHQFSRQVANSILGGRSVFDLADAQRAGEQLLEHGPVRVKPVLAKAGRGQEVIRDARQLADCLAEQDAEQVAIWGLVLEENLRDVVTFSVGQVQAAGITATYYGSQRLTRDNTGEEVYGGSDLTIVRGDYAELMRMDMPDAIRLAVSQAHVYEHAAFAAFGLCASRRNYDVAQGIDSLGKPRSGVLEQSWRIGGASAAEIFALEAFASDPQLQCVRASTYECYGESEPPDDAQQLYSGEEYEVGRLSKYVKVEPHVIAY